MSNAQPIFLPKQRIHSIDLLRGAIMMIMALDHTRDFYSNVHFNPVDLSQTNPALFLTRFITHYCAPIFVFLSGISICLGLSKGKSKKQQSIYLLTRGLWLILMEFTIVNWGWSVVFDFGFTMLQVIWAIGWSMIVLAALIHLPARITGILGILMILLHNTMDGIKAESWGSLDWLWMVLHEQGRLEPGGGITMFTMYPLIPWIGVMAAGYWCGTLYKQEPAHRKKILLYTGISAIALFIVLRWINVYGDPSPRQEYAVAWKQFFSFINVSKYPPSLDYVLVTIGPALCILALLDQVQSGNKNPLLVFGRVPFFYYLLHIWLIQASVALVAVMTGVHEPRQWKGFDLPGVYLAWLCIITILYFPCRWFMNIKAKHKKWWLSYL